MKFTQKSIDAIEPPKTRQVFFDESMSGLAIKVTPTGHKAFYYCYRPGKGRNSPKKHIQLGSFPDMTVEQARLKARQLLAQVINGGDPARDLQDSKTAKKLDDALAVFMAEYVSGLKPNTQVQYAGLAKRFVSPNLGGMRIDKVNHRDIAKLFHDLRGTPAMANRLAALLSKFFNWAIENGYRERNSNPVAGLRKNREARKTDFLTSEQLGLIGAAVADQERKGRISTLAAAALRLLMLTGARKNEILSLKWSYLNLEQGRAALPDSKTGFKTIQLPAAAAGILRNLPRADQEYVFPAMKEKAKLGHLSEIKFVWDKVLTAAGVGHWRIHDLRHALASVMVNSGASLPVVGKILGHTQSSTTARYAHLEANPARQALEKAAAQIMEAQVAAEGLAQPENAPPQETALH